MSKIKTAATTALFSTALLAMQSAIPSFKHHGFGAGIITWIATGLLSVLGPFAALAFRIPWLGGMWVGNIFLVCSLLIAMSIGTDYAKKRDRSLLMLRSGVAIWMVLGSYFSTLGLWSTI